MVVGLYSPLPEYPAACCGELHCSPKKAGIEVYFFLKFSDRPSDKVIEVNSW